MLTDAYRKLGGNGCVILLTTICSFMGLFAGIATVVCIAF